jgi:hypothetical protein
VAICRKKQQRRVTRGEQPPDREQAAEERGECVGEQEEVVGARGFFTGGGENDRVHAVAEVMGDDTGGDRVAGGVRSGKSGANGHAIAEAVEDQHAACDAAHTLACAYASGAALHGAESLFEDGEEEEEAKGETEDVGG